MGSVKDLEIIQKPTDVTPGKGKFIFSDRYSVFDWGQMPDDIPYKGISIAVLSSYFFEKLQKMGIKTHYNGLMEDNEIKKLDKLKNPSDVMVIDLLNVYKPDLINDTYNYNIYRRRTSGFLIPLEIIYRNMITSNSSLLKRIKKGDVNPKDIGLDNDFKLNEPLKNPIYDVSTKLEITDRYITWDEAADISNLSDKELQKIIDILNTVNNTITEEVTKIGLKNIDGKIEVGFNNNREIILLDVLGTLDECRFMYDGISISKEIARKYYRNSEWYKAVCEAKETNRQNWKEVCRMQPEPLPVELKKLISTVYCSCTNEITGREWFYNIPPLNEIVDAIREWI